MPEAITHNDETSVAEVLTSKKAVALLKSKGVLTVGDVKRLSMPELVELGLGEVTIAEIRAFASPAARREGDEDEIEEGPQPVFIRSPHSGFSLQVLPGDGIRNESGRGVRPVKPIYLVCSQGQGRMTREMWFMRKFKRDRVAVDAAIAANEPWRKDAVAWLKARKAHKSKDFVVMTD